jgi:hypothetical protein
MIESLRSTNPVVTSQHPIEICDEAFVVDAALVGELLRLPASRVQNLMRSGRITSACERGVDDHAGLFRLSFFYGNRRARLSTDLEGRVLRKSAIDFGDRPLPEAHRQPMARGEVALNQTSKPEECR